MARQLTVTRYTVADHRWNLPPLTIAFLSDFHALSPWMGREQIEGIVAQTNALNPGLVVLGGDYLVDKKQRRFGTPLGAQTTLETLRNLTAPLGVYGILGNHDWGDCPQARLTDYQTTSVIAAHWAADIPLLQNQAVKLHHETMPFWLVGTDSQRAVKRRFPKRYTSFLDADAAFADVPVGAPAIHLAHEPDYFATVDNRAFLQLSGHTHGGQIKLFGRIPVVPSDFGDRYVGGYIQENGNHLIVSRGIGTSGIPLRIGVPPEIVYIRITSEEGCDG